MPRTPTTLTRTEGYALTDTRKAIRPFVDLLITRTAYYFWDDAREAWTVEQTGLRVSHSNNHRWDGGAQRFVKCVCAHCHPAPLR